MLQQMGTSFAMKHLRDTKVKICLNNEMRLGCICFTLINISLFTVWAVAPSSQFGLFESDLVTLVCTEDGSMVISASSNSIVALNAFDGSYVCSFYLVQVLFAYFVIRSCGNAHWIKSLESTLLLLS